MNFTTSGVELEWYKELVKWSIQSDNVSLSPSDITLDRS